MAPDILLIDKPAGITSAKAVERVKKALGVRKAGHAGTLDPLATGLLIVGVNDGTKKLTEYLKLPKVYEAEVLCGVRTDTGDLEGNPIEEKIVLNIEADAAAQALAGMVGTLTLPVPVYSALKREGEALYKKARRGEMVEAPMRDMNITSAELLSVEGRVCRVRFAVDSGVYIRSLAEEFGRRLGLPATLAGLRRLRVGELTVADAKPLDAYA